jgi:uncharacterized cupin superfamily protein
MPRRPSFVSHWSALENAKQSVHPASGEQRGFSAPLDRAAGLTRLGVRHLRLMPGQRTSPPHAERDEEEFVFILEGSPDLWQDGRLHRLHEGQGVGWPDRTGTAHSILNNTAEPVRLLTVGEASRYVSQVWFPFEGPERTWFTSHGKAWLDPPSRRMGKHDGLPGTPAASRKIASPTNLIDWRAHLPRKPVLNAADPSLSNHSLSLSRLWGLQRLGVWIECLKPGWRSSRPHAEADEEEFIFILDGTPDLWQDGHLHRLGPGDFAGWASGTGLAHTVLNNTDRPVTLLCAGEASRQRGRVWYPFDPTRMKELGERAWVPERPAKFGPHDGIPDLHRPGRLS